MSEVLRDQRRLAEREMAAEELRMRLANLRRQMWEALDLLRPVEEIPASQLMALSADFGRLQVELRALLDEIAVVKRILGR